jgi:hypothetical protein
MDSVTPPQPVCWSPELTIFCHRVHFVMCQRASPGPSVVSRHHAGTDIECDSLPFFPLTLVPPGPQERDGCYDLAIQALLTNDPAAPLRQAALELALDSENGEFLDRLYTRMLSITQLHGLLCRLQPRDPAALVVCALCPPARPAEAAPRRGGSRQCLL